jgi:hypothetical protein
LKYKRYPESPKGCGIGRVRIRGHKGLKIDRFKVGRLKV